MQHFDVKKYEKIKWNWHSILNTYKFNMNKQTERPILSNALVPTAWFALEVSEGTREKFVSILSLLTQGVQQWNIRRRWKALAKSATPVELDSLVRNPHMRNNDFFEAVFDEKTTLPETRRFILSTYSLYRVLDDERIRWDYRWIQWAIDSLENHKDQLAVEENQDSSIVAILARSPKLSQSFVRLRLMQSSYVWVRHALAERKDLDNVISNVLIFDLDASVRCKAIEKSNLATVAIETILLDEHPESNTDDVKVRVLQRMDYSRRYYDDVLQAIWWGKIPTDLSLLIAISPFSTPEIRQRFLSPNTAIIKSGINDDIPF